MTAQINDTCFHRKIRFEVAGISGSGLFEPASIGVNTVMMSTACWRGYIAHYSILDGELFLTRLQIGLPHEEGFAPMRARGRRSLAWQAHYPADEFPIGFNYEGFQEPIPFTGGLLLAEGFIRELYVHMGFHPAWKYKTVREVIFDAGRLTEDYDRSAEMATIRAKAIEDMKHYEESAREPTRRDIEARIEKCFSREY